jgi:electron transfer flavoprotein alpha subunit
VNTRAACIAAVEGIAPRGDTLSFRRSVFNGKVVSNIAPETDSTVLTILPGMVKAAGFDNAAPGKIDVQDISITPQRIQNKALVRSRTDSQTVSDANIVISAGRGIGKKENLDLIYQLAERFSKSAVGGSRPICDLGWLGYPQQIGITGLTVSPGLYLACGISGAIQHLSGIRGADFIVAVNTDPKAAIFNMSDVCIVEDLMSFIPILIEELEKAMS